MAVKKVLMITTGGTIAGNVANKDDADYKEISAKYFQETMKGALDIIKQKWGIEVQIITEELCNIDSTDIKPTIWTELSNLIKERYDDYDSFLVIHGTNTLGYTCAALSFAFENLNKPIILTGSQVPYGRPGSDALMNLDNAIRLAVWPYHDIKGVMAVFGSHVISGVRVKKSTDFDYDAFKSFSTSSIGRVGRIITINEGNLMKHVEYTKKYSNRALVSAQLVVKNIFDCSIASFTEFPGMSVDFFKTVVEHNGVKGIILRAFGAGDASNNLEPAFEYLKEKKIPIVVTTQAPNGNANFQVNEPGKKLRDRKLAIPAFDMSIECQTVKLAWLLGQELDYEEINKLMVTNMRGEVNPFDDLYQ